MQARLRIILRNKQGEVIETFDGAYEAARELDIDSSMVYRYCATPDKCIRGMYWSKEKIVIEKKPKKPQPKKERTTLYTMPSLREIQLRKIETKEETRRRLGLSPYAYWCTPEGWAKLEEKVYPKLDAIGYFEEDAKAKIKHQLKAAEKIRKANIEGTYVDIDSMYIDPEFQSYFRQIRK